LGEPVYGAGWSRAKLSAEAGDGPTVNPEMALELSISTLRNNRSRHLADLTIYESPEAQIEVSEATEFLYGTLDQTIYAVISDEGYNGPFVGDKAEADAEAEFDAAVRDGHENVALVLVDRSGDPYEVVKRANSDRTSNPRHYGPRRPRR
jgi:hypothetical protein